MRTGKPKHKYPTDTEVGIRTLSQLRSIPAGQLTDEEHVKMFFDRFDARALLMVYYDQDNQAITFGRLKAGASNFTFYRKLINRLDAVFGQRENYKDVPDEEESHKKQKI